MRYVIAAAAALLGAVPAGAEVIDLSGATQAGGIVTVGAYRFGYAGYGNVLGLFQSASGRTTVGDVLPDSFGAPFVLSRTDGASFDLNSVTFGTTGANNRVNVGGVDYYSVTDGQTLLTRGVTGVTSVFFDALAFSDLSGIQSMDVTAAAAVPEPATWGMMILGFGLAGYGLRRRRPSVRTTVRFA